MSKFTPKNVEEGANYEFTYAHPTRGTVTINQWPHEAEDEAEETYFSSKSDKFDKEEGESTPEQPEGKEGGE